MLIIQGLKQFPVGAKQNCFFAQTKFNLHLMSMMSYLNNSLLPPSPSLSKKVVYLLLLHHTCSLKLNAGKVIQPYLQPFIPTGLNLAWN